MDLFSKLPKLNITKYIRLVVSLSFAWYFMSCITNPSNWHFIDNVDLIIHEAGHWIFVFFGSFVSVLGGSINQVLIPFVFFLYFVLKKDSFSASILFMWFGYNVVNISVYMSDAIKMNLPLLGGDSSIHDWNYILGRLGFLQYTNVISSTVLVLGIFLVIIGAVYAVKLSFGDKETVLT